MAERVNMKFAPSIYEHAAALVGKTPQAVSRDGDWLFRAHAEAFRLYGHAPLVVGIDIYAVEAEAYGARLVVPERNAVPCVDATVCAETAAIGGLPPLDPERDGRLPMILETGRRLAGAFPEAEVRIPICGPFSLASNLVGFDRLLCDVLDDPASVEDALRYLVQGQAAICRAAARRGLGVAIFESAAAPPLVSPDVFLRVEVPALTALVRAAASVSGAPVPCIIGGNTAPVLDAMLGTGAGYIICPYETDQAQFMSRMQSYPKVMVRINTGVGGFASGDGAAVCRELDRVLALAAGRDHICIGSGALPYATDPGIVLKAKAYVQERTAWPNTDAGHRPTVAGGCS